MTKQQSALRQSAEEFIRETSKQTPSTRGWAPPPHLIPELEKILTHNREHPERHIGAISIAKWLKRNGVEVSKDAVYRWIKHRSG